MAQTINVNTTPGSFPATLFYSQGDIGREFALRLGSSDGYVIPAGATVKMVATKPSGFGFEVAGTLSNGVATFVTTETMTNEAGRFPAEIRIEYNGDVIGTANFYLDGEPDPHPADTIDGDAETIIPELTVLVERVESAASSVLDMQVVATTLPAGSDATYSYDEETNTATFGIPKGADGTLSSGVLAPTYSTSATYAVGDYVYYSGSLYRCTTAITTAESWTSGHWTQVALAPEVTDLKSALTYKANLPTDREILSYEPQLSKYINSNGVVSSLGTFNNKVRVTSYIPIDGGKKYYINAFAEIYGTPNSLYAFYDSNYSPILWAAARSSADKFNGEVYAPITATYMVVAYVVENQLGIGIDPPQYLLIEKPVDLSEVYALNGNYEYKTNAAESTLTTGKLINANTGVISSYGDNKWAILDNISVQGGEEYLINATMLYNNGVIVIYDSSDNVINVVGATEGEVITTATYLFDDYYFKIPYGAVKMVVGVYTQYPYSVDKIVGYELLAETRNWAGKKWVVVGDSLTERNGRTTKNYHDYIAEKTGITVVNMGVSGSGYRNGAGSNKAFYQRISSVPTDADVVTIFGSFNDGLSDLGTATDSGTTTVGGCINTTIDNLYAVFPTVQLGIVSPTPWVGANPYDNPQANAYVELLEAICKKRSIPFLNLYYESNLRPWDSTFRTLAYSKDEGNGVHPDEVGHALIAPRFEGFLYSLLLS